MVFNSKYFVVLSFFFTVLLVLGASLEMIYWAWIFSSFLMIFRVYSHVSFILLILELLTMISLALVLYFLLKSGLEMSFVFLFLCLIVGEASLGLSLMVMSSRTQSYELISLNLM